MLITVEGTYKDGKIDLVEAPQGLQESRVIVTFLPEVKKPTGRMLTPGRFAGPPFTDEEDFKIAEWHGPRDAGEE